MKVLQHMYKLYFLFIPFFITPFYSVLAVAGEITNNKTLSNPNNTHPLGFIENKGQLLDQHYQPNPSCKYLLNLSDFKVQLRTTGFSYEITETKRVESGENKISDDVEKMIRRNIPPENYISYSHRIDIDFEGANTNPTIETSGKSADYFNYYLNGSNITGVYYYQKIVYKNIYDGIDVEYILDNKNNFKYNIIVNPGADAGKVKLNFKGAKATSLNENGNILIETSTKNIEEQIPYSYIFENNQPVKTYFNQIQENNYGITILNHNTFSTLVIDPTPNRLWSTYYGGSHDDQGYATTTDATGNVYLALTTQSTANIATVGAYQTVYANMIDGVLVQFNSSGIRQWGTYYGGPNIDCVWGVTCDASNNVYLSGLTKSPTGIATTGAHQTTFGGGEDLYLAKFDNAGIRQWATYFGGSGMENGGSITTNGSFIYMTGRTSSTTAIATPGAQQTTFGGSNDIFLVQFNLAGVRQWGTYYGGSNNDIGWGIDTDASGNIYITGPTGSTTGMTTPGAYQTAYGGGSIDAFLIKFNSFGVRQWCTYYGGIGYDSGMWTQVDAIGNIFISGMTDSPNAISTAGAQQPTLAGAKDAFLIKFNPACVRQWGTYYGGPGNEECWYLSKDRGGNMYITGNTSSATGIAVAGAHQLTYGGNTDAFFAKYNTSGVKQWSTYYGGSADDWGYGIACDNLCHVYICGNTKSTSAIATAGAHQTAYTGINNDGYLVQFEADTIAVNINATAILCNGANNGTAIAIPGSGSPAYSYLWNGGQTNATITGLGPGTYSVTVTDTNGCRGVQQTIITEPAAMNIIANSLPACGPGSAIAAVSVGGGNPSYTYSWMPGGGNNSIATGLSSGTYTCIVTDASSCSQSAIINVITYPLPFADAGSNTLITPGSSTLLSASGGGNYLWTPSLGLSCVNCSNPTASPGEKTTYYVTVTDSNGCTATDSVVVDITCKGFYIPNAFSPNNDGQNDIYYINGDCLEQFTFTIYNRWGEIVFQTRDASIGWDGKHRGNEMNTAVFSYLIEGKQIKGNTFTQKGNISLVR